MIMPDSKREECFRTAVFMNKFEKGKEVRREVLGNYYLLHPSDIFAAYTYAAYCFLYGEKSDILEQKDAIVEAERVFAIIVQKNHDEWLARYFSIRLNMLVSDDFRNDRDIDEDISCFLADEGDTSDACCQLTQLLKAESLFNLKKYNESKYIIGNVKEHCKKIEVLKDFFFNQLSSLYRKMIVCQRADFAEQVLEIQKLMFGE